jgi:hypothetical protein
MAASQGLDTRYNLVSSLKLVDPKGALIEPMKTCTESNPLLQDLPIIQSNGINSHEDSRETSIPKPQIIKIGDGHDASVSTWDNFKETISLFVDRIDVPKHVLDMMPNKDRYLASREDAHFRGFGQGVINHILYGSSVADPEKFDGLDVRYKTPDSTDPTNPSSASADAFVFDAGGGTGSDTCSIWLLQPAIDKLFGITPVNDPQMGIKIEDVGYVYDTAENSKQRRIKRKELEWKLGLCVKDMRACARIRNIKSSISNLNTGIISLIYQARNEVFRGPEPVIMYVPRRMMTHFHIMAENKQNVIYDRNNIYDVPMYRFGDMMIRQQDAQLITETGVAAV